MLLSFLIGLLSFLLVLLFVGFSGICIPETRNAVTMFLDTVLPTMFPFYVLSSVIGSSGVLTRICSPVRPLMQKVFRLPPGSIAVLVLGCLCGFPVGAKVTCDLKAHGDLTAEEAARLASFTNNVGPIFMVSIVGGSYLGSKYAGLILWLAVTVASFLSGFLLCRFAPVSSDIPHSAPSASVAGKIDIPAAILSSLNTVLYVGAVIIFFSSVTALLKIIPGMSSGVYALSYSFLEITGGLRHLAESVFSQNNTVKYMLTAAFCAWSGCSVHMQVCGILLAEKIQIRYYLAGKMLQTIIAPLVACLLFII